MLLDFLVQSVPSEKGVVLFFLQPGGMGDTVFFGGVAGGGTALFFGLCTFQGDNFFAFFLCHVGPCGFFGWWVLSGLPGFKFIRLFGLHSTP